MFDDGRRKGGVVAEKLDRLEVCGFAGKSKHKGFFPDVVCVSLLLSFTKHQLPNRDEDLLQ